MSPGWPPYKKQQIHTQTYMGLYGCKNVINCPCKSLFCMAVDGAYYDLHVRSTREGYEEIIADSVGGGGQS